jgi:hypothetical protein
MLKALVEKIELRFDRKNPSPLEALYQEYETDFPNVADPFRYQRTQIRLDFSHHQLSRHIKDAAQEFINAMLKIFKSGLNLHNDFLKALIPPAYEMVSRDKKGVLNIHPINKVIRLKK